MEIKVISYPKCGRTWLRMLLGYYFVTKYSLPEQDVLNSKKLMLQVGLPALTFTHEDSDWNATKKSIPYRKLSTVKTQHKDNKIIFLHRDIKDTLVSSYFQATKRDIQFEGALSEFIRDSRFGVKKILRFNQIWLSNKNTPKKFMSLSYEDIHNNTDQALTHVLQFLDEKNINNDAIRTAVKLCSFENMRRAELKNEHNSFRLQAGNIDDPESFKTRKGKIGGHVDYLTIDDIAYIDEVIHGETNT